MVTSDRNRMIRDIHRAYPYWSYSKIGDLLGISRQRVFQILQSCEKTDIMSSMDEVREVFRLDETKPISATEAEKLTGVPACVIRDWVRRNLVRVVSRPEHTTNGKFVLLHPVDLQARINTYKPHQKRDKTPA